ncbi:unnamed protein product, partial [Nesidiocoris tenuis]
MHSIRRMRNGPPARLSDIRHGFIQHSQHELISYLAANLRTEIVPQPPAIRFTASSFSINAFFRMEHTRCKILVPFAAD